MTQFRFTFGITNTTEAEMLSAVEWLKNNYESKIERATAGGGSLHVSGELIETTFNDTVTAILAFKTQFGTRLESEWTFQMTP